MLWSRRAFLRNRKQITVLTRFLSHSASDEIPPVDQAPTAGYLAKELGATHRHWAAALEKHKELYTVKREDLISSAKALQFLKYSVDDILQKPMLLYINSLTLQNRHKVLKECGCPSVPVSLLIKFVTVMNKNISTLKGQGFIPFEVDVGEVLRACFKDIELDAPSKYGDDIKLKILRQNLLNLYLIQRLGMDEKSLDKMWKIYPRVRHRSFFSIQRIIDVLLNDLCFSKERIIKNAFLLYGDPDNVKRMIRQIKKIDGQDFREILYRMPKIMMSSTDSLVKTMKHIKSFKIKEEAIIKCLEVLTLSPDTVLERLKDLQEVEEFQVLCTNPRILRLVHYQNKARLRLDYLNKLKVKCASLHVLSCGSEAFARFAREGSDRTKGRDVVVFLANQFHHEESNIRSILTRHPNWCHIPLVHVKHCYEHLISENFSHDDILENLCILLYPIKRIEEKLALLKKPETLKEMNVEKPFNEITKSEILALILYFIEREFHFTGDGVWTEQHSTHVENFHNILPDFPDSGEKNHRYGIKSAKPASLPRKIITTATPLSL